MTTITFADGAFEVDANIVAEGLGIAVPLLQAGMRSGAITTRSERGLDADQGRHRLTFFSGSKRFRLVIDEHGTIIQRSTLDFGNSPLPRAAHRPSG
ncbi:MULTISPECIES: DUF6522 family protein [Bradyrhizobium]|jgi:uncharacterized protein DUF6522|uniref:DUF6522 family protein n=1 Tax=Bradyrhizobium brasilense TaxID=1419277 RepID=A0ABY8JNG8_9BRAD|nr:MULTISPECIES: DUF6522 family protein [Bradyrhizobium]MCA1402260.1 hypothetical protein [Bradyrhizobium sp. BRP56]MCA6103382.1 hypothetical protein [Bradyrhizobium australafricanum]MCP1850862.1 hypothetical protein [Bradyrhizobium sp. USDA 4541]MCP3414024.1 DUF6522 family protein [Bradyrhizobium brasilense]MCS3450820.1 hypothetical protein [Bradyrhizobium elkanii]